VDLAAGVAIVVLAGAALWRITMPVETTIKTTEKPRAVPALPTEPVALENTFFRGRPNAPVTILEYADFECPACKQFAADVYPHLAARFVDTGRVRFGFRHFPLSIHPMARQAAIAAQCAGEQGKFWEFYEELFRRPGRIDEPILRTTAISSQVKLEAWQRCQATYAGGAVDRQSAEAQVLNLRGTPTFLLGPTDQTGTMTVKVALYGVKPVAEFEQAIRKTEESNTVR
jgi:protein-disulfide isomerase